MISSILILIGKEEKDILFIVTIPSVLGAFYFFIVAFGLWHLKKYARILILIDAFGMLILPPIIGTLFGILLIIYFRKPAIRALFYKDILQFISREQVMYIAAKTEKPPKTIKLAFVAAGIYVVIFLLAALTFFIFGKFTEKPISVVTIGEDRVMVQEYMDELISQTKRKQAYLGQSTEKSKNFYISQLSDQILWEMIAHKLLLQSAEELDITATKDELIKHILKEPAFLQDGKFIGYEKYKHILAYNNIDVISFEKGIKESIIIDKLTKRLTVDIPEEEKEKFLRDYIDKLWKQKDIEINREVLFEIKKSFLRQ